MLHVFLHPHQRKKARRVISTSHGCPMVQTGCSLNAAARRTPRYVLFSLPVIGIRQSPAARQRADDVKVVLSTHRPRACGRARSPITVSAGLNRSSTGNEYWVRKFQNFFRVSRGRKGRKSVSQLAGLCPSIITALRL